MATAASGMSSARFRIAGPDCYWPRAVLHLNLTPWLVALPQRDVAADAASAAPVWQALAELAADAEWVGNGEMFVDVTHGQRRHGTPEQMAQRVQARIAVATNGWQCTVGVGGTRLSARYASTLMMPGGVSVIAPWETGERLRDVAVERLFPVGPRIAAFLAGHGVSTCGEVAALPSELFVRRLGIVGRQLWLACQGRDSGAAVRDLAPSRAITQAKVLPPRTASVRTLQNYLRHLCERVASRLRRLDMQAARLHVGLRYAAPRPGVDTIVSLAGVAPDGRRWFELARAVLCDHGEPVLELKVTAMHPENCSGQLELFTPEEVQGLRPTPTIDSGRSPDEEFLTTPI